MECKVFIFGILHFDVWRKYFIHSIEAVETNEKYT